MLGRVMDACERVGALVGEKRYHYDGTVDLGVVPRGKASFPKEMRLLFDVLKVLDPDAQIHSLIRQEDIIVIGNIVLGKKVIVWIYPTAEMTKSLLSVVPTAVWPEV